MRFQVAAISRAKLDNGIVMATVLAWLFAWSPWFTIAKQIQFLHYLFVLFPLLLFSLVLIEQRTPSLWRPIAWIGDITYSSYLIHFPLQLAFALTIGWIGWNETIYRSGSLFVTFFILLIGLSLASYHWFERPMQSLIRHHFLRRLPK